MPLRLTARYIMWVLVTGAGIVFVLHWLWPLIMRWRINSKEDGGENWGNI